MAHSGSSSLLWLLLGALLTAACFAVGLWALKQHQHRHHRAQVGYFKLVTDPKVANSLHRNHQPLVYNR